MRFRIRTECFMQSKGYLSWMFVSRKGIFLQMNIAGGFRTLTGADIVSDVRNAG